MYPMTNDGGISFDPCTVSYNQEVLHQVPQDIMHLNCSVAAMRKTTTTTTTTKKNQNKTKKTKQNKKQTNKQKKKTKNEGI